MEVTYPDVYDLGRQIGEGSFGSVHLAVSRLTGRNYVVKEVRTSGLNKYGQLNLTFLLGEANALWQMIKNFHLSIFETDKKALEEDQWWLRRK